MKNKITRDEFNEIKQRLKSISHTWSDLWDFLSLTDIKVSEAVQLQYTDIYESLLDCTHNGIALGLSPEALGLINRRKKLNSKDRYIFQSRSNRVKYKEQPVTVIAFNAALRNVGISIGLNKISSKHAKYKIQVRLLPPC
ncbi:hypothetical protein MUU46_04750 [Scandinavium sp. TWS1a]|uniref:hypothetical protein n=1 Tax=Scandinavium tedordense TaxID=2926521 RepID=UPI002165C3FD|nr:hypothetical protein [Scandinavium tedordense]MCS2169630.1 hypothetical protein [Scandinavium tedordense]